MDFLKDLNENQQQSATALEGPVMIVAGAGSGKTRVLTYRIAYAMSLGNDPFRILALTFTNKAAREMRDRIEKLVGSDARNLWMGTFHSIFARVLRAEAKHLGFESDFSIYDSDDSKSVLKGIVKEWGLDDKLYKINSMASKISSLKNKLIGPQDLPNHPNFIDEEILAGRKRFPELFVEYQKRLFKSGAMDFDDLLYKTWWLFNTNPEVLYKYQHRFHFILVDEYQDTNPVQYEIIKMLSAVFRNICVVGDDAQSIYGFRGADISNILNYEKDYPDYRLFKLEQNYRSTKTIVAAASDIIKNNLKQIEKNIWTDNDIGEKITITRCSNDTEEGKMVAQSIFEEKMRRQKRNNEFAILYRTNAQSRSMEEALRRLNIPYRIYGGLSFYQRKEVKDLIAYLRIISNPSDQEALKRIINYPARGIGDKTIQKLVVVADQNNMSIWNVIQHAQSLNLGTIANKVSEFGTMVESFVIESKKLNAADLAELVAKQSGILHDLHSDKSVEGLARFQNLEELLNGIREFVEDENQEDKSLSAYLQNIALVSTTDTNSDEEENDKVTLMSIHMAKGLEFPFVYLVGLEDGLFPGNMSLTDKAELEEERRLFYVAVTRAEEVLKISYAVTRFKNGSLIFSEPSRFLGEINPAYVSIEGNMNTVRPVYGGGGTSGYGNRPVYQRPQDGNVPSKDGGLAFTPISKSNPSFAQKAKTAPLQFNTKKEPSAPSSVDFTPSDPSEIVEGCQVEHARFGQGLVEKIEKIGGDSRATIRFGQETKSLVLKFARLRVIPS
jgi:DNA helicase-2/ATP-dependent DNA helicase PcrA